MTYREYPPHPALRAHVACMWTARVTAPVSAAAPHVHRVLPDNCIDILWQDGRQAFAVGMMSASFLVPAARPVRTVAVRFKPGAAGLFLGMPLHPLTDARAEIAGLWGRATADRLDDALWTHELTDRQRIALVERELLRRLADAPLSSPGSLGLHAVAAIEAAHGAMPVEALAGTLRVSRQHLALQFRQQVGLTPKLFARICRFRRALALLREPSRDGNLAALATDCGYFDQSHLIRDFRDFADGTPGGL
ncbi:helix-turn-helix domain-containing protein [Massilia dura]|uniref:Helix-turn-helix domain-containing protein n=1 Tax=Pseudoduganella dura TaxID=321982 RepID=A0A6I3XL36_9BURK|nr:helix-turn-helix transcriptional regulator [Pseudoduganella dura]MUI13912.1 helix-turn-helix domain-containing protein [Pseudoduganella dura]